MKSSTRFTCSAASIVSLLVLISSLAYGQIKVPKPGDLSTEAKPGKLVSTPSGAVTALEGAIDPAVYVLGPGDQVELGIWGAMEERQGATVSPDGSVSFPGIGSAVIAGFTVSDAGKIIQALAKGNYPRAEITLKLTSVRMMKVSISGAVERPGIYDLNAIDRLTTLIEKAGGLKKPDEDKSDDPGIDVNLNKMTPAEQRRYREEAKTAFEALPEASLRHLKIKSANDDSIYVDLQRYFVNGEMAFNPVLKDGDAVNVPLLTRLTGVVSVFGAVKNPGDFEFVANDNLQVIVNLAGGFRSDASTNDIVIVRFDEKNSSSREVKVDIEATNAANVLLKPDDRIFIRKKTDYRQKYQVVIKGEVKFPGTYPIEQDQTKLSELIEACGGLTDRANLYSARIVRRALIDTEDPEYERLKALSVADMTEMEYEYFKIRSREEAPPVVVDFEKLIRQGDTSQDIVLHDKDEIEFPTISPTVKVAGQVNNPGLIRYVPGEDYYYYIQKAGGYSWNARKGMLRLIKAHSGTWMKPKKSTPIEIGDTIFIPEKQEVDWWELSKDLLLVASQVATVMIMIKSL